MNDKPNSNNEVMTEKEAAGFLKISVRKLWELRKLKKIPFHFIDRQVRYLRAELIAWLMNGGTEGAL